VQDTSWGGDESPQHKLLQVHHQQKHYAAATYVAAKITTLQHGSSIALHWDHYLEVTMALKK